MTKIPVFIVDAFTPVTFCGNQAAVCLLNKVWVSQFSYSLSWMQQNCVFFKIFWCSTQLLFHFCNFEKIFVKVCTVSQSLEDDVYRKIAAEFNLPVTAFMHLKDDSVDNFQTGKLPTESFSNCFSLFTCSITIFSALVHRNYRTAIVWPWDTGERSCHLEQYWYGIFELHSQYSDQGVFHNRLPVSISLVGFGCFHGNDQWDWNCKSGKKASVNCKSFMK